MHLVRDLLDNEVFDVKNRRMGKVDGIVLVMRRGQPPRVAAIELGLSALGRRISRTLGRWATTIERRLGVSDGAPVRVDVDRIEHIGIDVRTNVDGSRTNAFAWEKWIDGVLVCHIPGSGHGVPEEERK